MVFPESLLPYPKETISQAAEVFLRYTVNENADKAIKGGLTWLSVFINDEEANKRNNELLNNPKYMEALRRSQQENNILSNQKTSEEKEIVLLKDNDWSIIDGSACRVLNFIPMGIVKDGKAVAINRAMPYAAIELECKKLPQKAKGYICHKIDFMHLWLAFEERGVKEDEEVIILYSKKHYKNIVYKILSFIMPRLWVMICKKGAYELITDPNCKPELQGEARFIAKSPLIEWKPEVMM